MTLTNEMLDLLEMRGVLDSASGLVGTEPDTARELLGLSILSLVGGLAKRAESAPGADAVFDLVAGADSGLLDGIDSYFQQSDDSEIGSYLVNAILGSRQEQVIHALSERAAIGHGVVKKFLPVLAPVVLSYLRRKATQDSFTAGDLATALHTERSTHVGTAVGALMDLLGGGNEAADNAEFLVSVER